MLGAEVGTAVGKASIAEWLAGVSSIWQNSDLLVGNLESPCIDTANPINGPRPELIFHAPASRVRELKDAGFSVLTLANNHILNCGVEGLKQTLRALDEAGVHHTGAGMNLAEAMEPAFVPLGNHTVGFVAFCYGPQAGRSTPGAAPYDPRIMREAISAARAKADIVIAALHDGLEYSDVPPSKTRARFRFLAENGADIVIGHHPHVLQGLEWHGGVPIAYSLGDFLFHNSLPHVAARNFSRIAMGTYAPNEIRRDPHKFSRGAILRIMISGDKKTIEWHPFRQSNELRPTLCCGAELHQDLRRIEELSRALNDSTDPRHALADRVSESAWWAERQSLSAKDLMKLLAKPKWRYLPLGLKWIGRHVRNRTPA